jgi:homoserine kinase type II
MAVFTPVSLEEITPRIATDFVIGEAILLKGIHGGIENSNFFLNCQDDGQVNEYVLTIFERLSFTQLPYYLELMLHLANQGIPVPKPIVNRQGALVIELKGKPACIVTKLPGQSELAPQPEHCEEVGSMLAKMHLAGQSFSLSQPNLRSLSWWQETVPLILPHITDSQKELLVSEMQYQESFFKSGTYQSLPAGPCHCDLFRDNVLFTSKQGQSMLGGFFDFYFAGNDKWLFDLAVTANDWCLKQPIQNGTGEIDRDRLHALLSGYLQVRPLTDAEEDAWPAMLRAAALRFWISRLWDFYLPRNAQMLTPHDPSHFERILLSRRHTT